ncbi:MAG: hypothetical protein V4807_12325 [Burkholderia gladioli]|uniref:hypothetical protein n=1 Tax=Burkholderia gladioli TaxID=28095 RepID=UPI0028660EF7|nr:hypothetical protein [Burkholderia gladioli]MDR8091076.1 hypothetical protein [Burkholderia gladioli]
MKAIIAAVIAATALSACALGPSTEQRAAMAREQAQERAEAAAREQAQQEQQRRDYAQYANAGPSLKNVRGGINPVNDPRTLSIVQGANVQMAVQLRSLDGNPVGSQVAGQACAQYAYQWRIAANAANGYSKANYVQRVGDAAYSYCARVAASHNLSVADSALYITPY